MAWFKKKIEVPGEVIYETIGAEDDAGFGHAVADITSSKPHFHRHMVEVYTLISGVLEVTLDGRKFLLSKPSDSVVIGAYMHHSAKILDVGGKPARIAVVTIPPWSAEDHILVSP